MAHPTHLSLWWIFIGRFRKQSAIMPFLQKRVQLNGGKSLIHCVTHHYEANDKNDPRYLGHNSSKCDWVEDYDPLKHCKEPIPTATEKRKTKVKGKIANIHVESVMVDGKPMFLCSKKDEKSVFVQDYVVHDGITYVPVQNLQPYDNYSFTAEEIEKLNSEPSSKESLLENIEEQTNRYIVASTISKDLTTIDIFMSYCMEQVDTVHFPFYVGETESGKSSCAHLFKNLAYRCLYSLDMTTPNVYQFLGQDEEGQGVIVEDEAQGI